MPESKFVPPTSEDVDRCSPLECSGHPVGRVGIIDGCGFFETPDSECVDDYRAVSVYSGGGLLGYGDVTVAVHHGANSTEWDAIAQISLSGAEARVLARMLEVAADESDRLEKLEEAKPVGKPRPAMRDRPKVNRKPRK